MKQLLITLKDIGFAGFLDMFFMWLLIYTLLVWSKRTRARSVLTGILIVAGFYLLTRQFNLTLTAAVFERFFAVILIALVVIFQEELKYLFEQVAVWSLNRGISRRKAIRNTREEISILVRTLHDLAKEKIGALIVMKGKDLIVRHLTGGIDLNGEISEAILKSLFDPHSIGHDGAVLIEGGTIKQFSVHLPLSKNLKKVGKGGTRHAAALGLAELSDALCLVVSEERGTVSVARNGQITPISDPDKLTKVLENFYQDIYPKVERKPWEGFIRRNSREKTVAIVLAVALWFVLVFGQKLTYKTFTVPVAFSNVPENLLLEDVKPNQVYVTLGGPRNAFYFLEKKINLVLPLEQQLGEQKIRIYPTDLQYPENLSMEILVPQMVTVTLNEKKQEEPKKENNNKKSLTGALKKVLPFTGTGDTDKPADSAGAAEKTGQPAAAETPPPAVQEAKSVSPLENVEPEEVVKYLEKQLDEKAVINSLGPESAASEAKESQAA